ncbi:Binding Protein (BGBP) [Umbelopsis sp. WA50703]
MKDGGVINLWGSDETACTDNSAGGCERESFGESGGTYLNPIQSAKIKLDKSFSVSYGRVEVNARLPKGDWIWPGIWLMPKHSQYGTWPASGEIDIVETRGNVNYTYGNVTTAGSTIQWGPSGDLNGYMDTHVDVLVDSGKSFADDFHIWGLEWNEDGLRTYVDNTTMLSVNFDQSFWERGKFPKWATNPWKGAGITAPFDQEFYLIMNVAVGGTNGYFPDTKEKPWKNADPRAVNKFWDRRKQWQRTWGSKHQSALAVESVKIWTKDQSKCNAWNNNA